MARGQSPPEQWRASEPRRRAGDGVEGQRRFPPAIGSGMWRPNSKRSMIFAFLGRLIMASFAFQGTSGASYTYSLLPIDLTTISRQAGNFILATGSAANPVPIMIDHATNIRETIKEMMASQYWLTATDIYGVTFLYVHIDASKDAQSRLMEKIDLIDFYHPPMNRNGDEGDDKQEGVP